MCRNRLPLINIVVNSNSKSGDFAQRGFELKPLIARYPDVGRNSIAEFQKNIFLKKDETNNSI